MKQKIYPLLLLLLSVLMPLQLATISVFASSAPTQFTIPDTTFTVKGFTSPNAFVQIFDGDALIGTIVADQNGIFTKNFPAMTSGLHNVRLQYQDQSGVLSDTVAQTINIRAQSDTAVEYYLPPTVSIDRSNVAIGDLVTFSGSTLPNATIEIVLDSGNLILRPQSDANGNYSIAIDTTGYYFGEHSIRATSLLGGLKSFQTEKSSFEVLPFNPNDDTTNAAAGELTAPVIENGGIVITDLENNLVRGTAPAYTQVIVYVNGEPIGSTFADGAGNWFFNTSILSATSEVKATACRDGECSAFSNTLTYMFEGEFGRCSTFRFWLSQYRFWGVTKGKGVDLPVTGVSGNPPFDILVDWGNNRTERFNRNDTQSYNIHHVYENVGQFNGSITVVDENECEYTRYFSVDVKDNELETSWLIGGAGLLTLTLTLVLARRYRVRRHRLVLAR